MKRILSLFIVLILLGSLFACDKENQKSPPDNPRTYDEYCAYLENYAPFPVWFVFYDDISCLGEFVGFEEIVKKGEASPFCANVVYTLKDTLGTFILQCDHWYLYKEGFESYEGVQYEKDGEKITHVSWVYKGTEFTVYELEDYPENAEGTFVSRLLNPETLDAAVAEFNLRVKGY